MKSGNDQSLKIAGAKSKIHNSAVASNMPVPGRPMTSPKPAPNEHATILETTNQSEVGFAGIARHSPKARAIHNVANIRRRTVGCVLLVIATGPASCPTRR